MSRLGSLSEINSKSRIYHVLAVISARDVQNGDENLINIRNLGYNQNSDRLLVQLRGLGIDFNRQLPI